MKNGFTPTEMDEVYLDTCWKNLTPKNWLSVSTISPDVVVARVIRTTNRMYPHSALLIHLRYIHPMNVSVSVDILAAIVHAHSTNYRR